LKGGGLDDGRLILEPGLKNGSGPPRFLDGEGKTANREGEIPAGLFEFGFRKQAEQSEFGGGEDAGEGWRWFSGQALQHIGGALGNAAIVIPEVLDQAGCCARLGCNQGGDFYHPADRESVPALAKK